MEQSCSRCGHPLSDHCKGNIQHDHHTDVARMVSSEYRRFTLCSARHCDQPLCSCIEFMGDSTKELKNNMSTKNVKTEPINFANREGLEGQGKRRKEAWSGLAARVEKYSGDKEGAEMVLTSKICPC